MALALASLYRWRKEVEHAAQHFMSQFSRWARTSDTFLVLLLIAIVALAIVYIVPWIARRIASPGLGCTFDDLTPEQKGFLTIQFMRGLRRVEVPPMTSRQRWFEALVRLRYVERRDIPLQASQPMPYEVTAAAWRELRRKLAREGDASGGDLDAGQAEP